MADHDGGRTCPRCAAGNPADARFCTHCGLRLDDSDVGSDDGEAAPDTPLPDPLLVECPVCGATNAASRGTCGRCRAELRVGAAGSAVPPAPAPPDAADLPAGRETPTWLLLVVVLAGLIVAGVLLALVMARVREVPPVAPDTERLELARATASSTLRGSDPAALIDGDPGTAWTEGDPGEGVGQSVTIELATTARVHRIVIANGDQSAPERFYDNSRVARLRIEAGGRAFQVDLQDLLGLQAVDLPAPVTTSSLRLVIEEVHPGLRDPDTALSEVQVHGVPQP